MTTIPVPRETLVQVLDALNLGCCITGIPEHYEQFEAAEKKLKAAIGNLSDHDEAWAEQGKVGESCERCGAVSVTGLSLCEQCNKD